MGATDGSGRCAGLVAIVTGGAQGIGAAVARRLVDEGASVLIGDIKDERGSDVARTLGDRAAYCALDVRDEQAWAAAVEACRSRFGPPTILVNNAYRSSFKPLLEETVADWDHTHDVVLKGAFLGMRATIPAMQAAGRGSIVNVCSTSALIGVSADASYQAAKGGLRMLTKNAAITFAADGIRANAVFPGAIRTDGVIEDGLAPFQDAFVERTPIARPGTAAEVAAVVVHLASREASFTTGADYVVDGGLTAM